MRLITLADALILVVAPAHAQTSGPRRYWAAHREIGIGTPATLKFQVNVEALPDADRDRLSKQCKPADKTLCIVTVLGTEMDDPMMVKAAKIRWYD
jgi:hypothetical protein